MPGFVYSLRFRLIVLVLLAIIPALGLVVYSDLEQRRVATESAQEDAFRLTTLAAGDHDTLIESTRQLLSFLSQLPQTQGDDPELCNRFMADVLARYPLYTAFGVVGPDGTTLCSSAEQAVGISLAGQSYFQRVLQTQRFEIGEFTIGRLSQRPVLPVVHPVVGEAGQVERVILASLSLDWLYQIAGEVQFPQDSALLIVDQSGMILARYPDPERWVGEQFPEAETILANLALSGAGVTEAAGVDGVLRLYAFIPLQSAQTERVFVTIGIPNKVAYAAVNRILTRNLIALGLVSLLALAAAWFGGEAFFLRYVNRLLGVTQRLASGDLSARSGETGGHGELNQLAQAFDHMAASLQQRERELVQSEASLRVYTIQLERSNRELQDFAYIASHDLQEPLRKIQAFSERLLARYADQLGEEGRDYAQRMDSAASRLQAMINDLLAYSRVTTQAQPAVLVDLNQTIQEVLSDLEVRIEKSGGQVIVGELPTLQADPRQMYQLLQNLIGNGLKFHRKGVPPVVKVCAESISTGRMVQDEMTRITVEDNGIGFEEKYLDRVFQPFQRLHARGVYEGSGIGLAISRKIVERHGGTLTAQSQPEKGSIFIITLPVHLTEQIGAETYEQTQ